MWPLRCSRVGIDTLGCALSLIGFSEEAPTGRTGECWKVNVWTTNSATARAPTTGIGAP